MVYLFKHDNSLHNTSAQVEKSKQITQANRKTKQKKTNKKHSPDSIYLLIRQSGIHAYSNIYLYVVKFSPAC